MYMLSNIFYLLLILISGMEKFILFFFLFCILFYNNNKLCISRLARGALLFSTPWIVDLQSIIVND